MSKKTKPGIELFHDQAYILCKEFGWSYEQLLSTPINFINAMTERIITQKKKEQKEMKKR